MSMSTTSATTATRTADTVDAVATAPTKAEAPVAVKPAGKPAKKLPPQKAPVVKKSAAAPWVDALAKPAAKPVTPLAAKAVTAKPAAAKKVPKPTKPLVAAKPKAKLVRDSFTMPQVDFDLIAALKDRALGFKRPTKKSELLRAGLQVLAGLSADSLELALGRLAPLKAGRPKKAD